LHEELVFCRLSGYRTVEPRGAVREAPKGPAALDPTPFVRVKSVAVLIVSP
jgi:hypothetical protein